MSDTTKIHERRRNYGCRRIGCVLSVGIFIVVAWVHAGSWVPFFTGYQLESPGVFCLYLMWAEQIATRESETAQAEGAEALAAMLAAPIPKTLLLPTSGNDPQVRSGMTLPLEFHYSRPNSPHSPQYRPENLSWGKLVTYNFAEYLYYRRIALAFIGLRDLHSSECVEFLANRADILPPERVDILVAWTFTLNWKPSDTQIDAFWEETRPAWRDMVDAKNPVYRLKALGYVRHWAENDDEINRVCLKGLEEQNTVFLFSVVDALGYVKHIDPAVLGRLKELVNDPVVPDNDGTLVGPEGFPSFREVARKLVEEYETDNEKIGNDLGR